MSNGIVIVNHEGKFLQVSEVSSHSTRQHYAPYWGELNNATVFKSRRELFDITWKEANVGRLVERCASLNVKEVRTVQICNEEEQKAE